MTITLPAFVAGLTLGAWGGATLLNHDHTSSPTVEVHPTQSIVRSLAESLPAGMRAVTGLDIARMLDEQGQPAAWRTWTDDENRQVKARLVNRGELTVTLQLQNNSTATWPIERLSLEDQVWLALQRL